MKFQKDLSEIRKIPKNGYNVVSLFSGAGGNSLGYLLNGYTIKMALEFDKEAKETYERNFPTTPVMFEDIRKINGNDILEKIGLKKYELDILDGSPPCASFSTAGSREKKWGEEKEYSGATQRTDDLFFEYLRIVKDVKPKVFVAENVKGLTAGNAAEYLDAILKKADSIGYNCQVKVLDSSKYNVPQKRERTIFIGVRKDLELSPVFPKESDKIITTREAIEDLIHEPLDCNPPTEYYLTHLKGVGPHADDKTIKEYIKKIGHSLYLVHYRRNYWDKPCVTLLASSRPPHPIEHRRLSLKEGLRIQSFPDDYVMLHTPGQNWERIGRSAPPNLLAAVSKTIEEEILNKVEEKTYEECEEFFSKIKDEYDAEKAIEQILERIQNKIEKTEKPKTKKNKEDNKTMKEKDNLLFKSSWRFDSDVTEVFTDMIGRSIPGYNRMREDCFNIGQNFVKPETNIIEIGCSNGLSIKDFVEHFDDNNTFYLYDNSEPMIEEAKKAYKGNSSVIVECADATKIDFPANSSLAMSIFTLQFIPVEYREGILKNIYNSLNEGGALILAEKVLCNDIQTEKLFEKEYYSMKAAHGYSEEQIVSKKKSLENNLVPLKIDWNFEMLKNVGFKYIDIFWKDLMFCGIIAIK